MRAIASKKPIFPLARRPRRALICWWIESSTRSRSSCNWVSARGITRAVGFEPCSPWNPTLRRAWRSVKPTSTAWKRRYAAAPEGADRRACRRHGCRRRLRLSRDPVCAADHRRHDLCGRRGGSPLNASRGTSPSRTRTGTFIPRQGRSSAWSQVACQCSSSDVFPAPGSPPGCVEELPRRPARIDEVEETRADVSNLFETVAMNSYIEAKSQGVALKTHMVAGHPVPAIAEFAERGCRNDLVADCSRNRAGAGLTFLT